MEGIITVSLLKASSLPLPVLHIVLKFFKLKFHKGLFRHCFDFGFSILTAYNNRTLAIKEIVSQLGCRATKERSYII